MEKYRTEKKILPDISKFYREWVVPEVGIEPTRGCPRRILNPVRLPISPLRHIYLEWQNYLYYIYLPAKLKMPAPNENAYLILNLALQCTTSVPSEPLQGVLTIPKQQIDVN
jgi:hypothetical protein